MLAVLESEDEIHASLRGDTVSILAMLSQLDFNFTKERLQKDYKIVVLKEGSKS